jgi:hypothetical protein
MIYFNVPTHYLQIRPTFYNVVSISTRYGLDSPGIESQWEARFSAPVQTGSGPTQSPVQWVPSPFPGGKAAGAWR